NFVDCVTAVQMLQSDLFGWLLLGPVQPLFEAFLECLEKLPIPAFVVGFKLSDPGPHELLARLETALRESLRKFPDLAQSLKREKIGAGEFLTLQLDSSRTAWAELIEVATGKKVPAIDDKHAAIDENTFAVIALKAIADRLERRCVTLSLGLYEDYL